jgi:hypothetical protein
VADREQQSVAVDQFGVIFEVGVCAQVDAVPVALGPGEERLFSVRPAGRPGVAGQTVPLEVADVGVHVRVGRVHRGDTPASTGRLVQIPSGRRPP